MRDEMSEKQLLVRKRDGRIAPFEASKVTVTLGRCAEGLDGVSAERVYQELLKNAYDGISTEDIDRALIMSAATFIEREPNYSYLAARLYQQRLRKEVFGRSTEYGSEEADREYRDAFGRSVRVGVAAEVLDPRLLDFDLDRLAKKLDVERDRLFKYIGVETLYERYFTKADGKRLETPQTFWMRVAMGLAINEAERDAWAETFYDVLSLMLYTPSTPTLFHSGLRHPQLASCFLTTADDDLKDIFKAFGDNSQLSKWSGGIGNDWTNVRSIGSLIHSTQVDSQGVVPFLKIANDTTVAINRSGKRRGATVAYLEVWHLDIEDFFDLKKNTGDERRRTHDMNTANWIPDLFMQRARDRGEWTLFSPDEVPDLHGLYGARFKEAYVAYEAKARAGEMRRYKVVDAEKMLRKMVTILFETGHPWMCFKDPCNVRSPQDHVGVVNSSNLCCVGGDDLVATSEGFHTVRELYEKGAELRLAGRHGVVNSSPMFMPRPNTKLVRILTQEGYTHTVTPDHKVWLSKGEYREAKDLTFGDKLVIQPTVELWGNVHLPEEAFLAGLWCGDGTSGVNNVCLDIWPKSYCLIQEIERSVSFALEKCKGKVIYDHASIETPKFADENNGRRRLASSALKCLFSSLGYTHKLSVPSFVLRGDRETVCAFLRGLYSCDGTVTDDKEITVASLSSVNLEMLRQIQVIWSNLGCKTSLTKMRDAGIKELPDGRGGKCSYSCQTMYRLMHTSINACRVLEEVTGLGNHRQCYVFLDNLNKRGYRQKMYATFTKLESVPDGDAFCPSVDAEDRLWTCNGLLTKNTEITLNTSWSKLVDEVNDWVTGTHSKHYKLGEVAVCNIGSVVLSNHMKPSKDGWYEMDWYRLANTVRVAMRMLDNVIDLNFYPTPESKWSNLNHRPVGLGVMGLQDALFKAGIAFEDATDFCDRLQECISYYAIDASCELAQERGAYRSFKGSKWERGIFPLDTLALMDEERGEYVHVNRNSTLDWTSLKAKVVNLGMRNSNTMAIAPTATISTLSDCFPCTEPVYKNLYVKSNMSGEFTVVNEYLVKDLKDLGIWDQEMLDDLKFHDGSVQNIDRVPDVVKARYKEAFEIDQKVLINLTAVRGKWIDQSQSHNIFFNGNSGNVLRDLYLYAWKKGLKTTYYLRTLGASQAEKSTLDAKKYGFTQKREQVQAPVKQCRIDDPTCEACQ